ncbi:DUF2075 domain-containing protein [Comamonas avium]|uniref:DUF2075 domain-containing protein n=1 Tax=Comamonas avium TaxID=2762231 RepID=A0ABR8SBQ0_9BURK|nr:DUF2075 domain-containing protein [Comamonas avium]MBD7960921.1 DUF2075 domain-containing protein [Comamonas avium]
MQTEKPTHLLVYQSTVAQFLQDCDEIEISSLIHDRYVALTGGKVGPSEQASWKNSLSEMARVLRRSQLDETVGVGIELFAPQATSRVDFSLSGLGAEGDKKVILIELKQWSSVDVTEKDAIVRTVLGGGKQDVPHPSYQAWSYANLFEGFNEAVSCGDIKVVPCAFLHNYESTQREIIDQRYDVYLQKAPLFLKGDLEKFREFLREHLHGGDNGKVIHALIHAKIGASKALIEGLNHLLKENKEFVLIDQQKLVYEAVRATAKAAAPGKHRVIIVEGGPGTGKSLIAINLLVKLLHDNLAIRYVSKNSAPRHVYKSKLTKSTLRSRFDSLFCGPDSFHKVQSNTFDLLLVDEAHRLTEKSGAYGNLGENQVKELINAAKCTVFFIDEDQCVTFKDIGSKAQIRRWAQVKGAVVEEYELQSQFRCSGSDGYISWLDNILGIRSTANHFLDSKQYDFRIFDSPQELHEVIESKNIENKARVVAGYCWPWSSKNDISKMDIVIGNYQRQWNLSSNSSVWIVTPGSIDQVGCIHTCQGLEVEYVGVIVGPDLIVRDGQVVTAPEMRSSMDQSIRGYKTRVKTSPNATKALADKVIRNTYRTLMTRGLKGCYIYCTDDETRSYFKARLEGHGSASSKE